uniref:Uncharacterized protein n=1 Tax=Physcomitrium patens TaxID=3218 RepID=A0A2K1KIG9_PHYPA|nr:hypothetical protein PHYPA_007261 [Physcomitrium patens]
MNKDSELRRTMYNSELPEKQPTHRRVTIHEKRQPIPQHSLRSEKKTVNTLQNFSIPHSLRRLRRLRGEIEKLNITTPSIN